LSVVHASPSVPSDEEGELLGVAWAAAEVSAETAVRSASAISMASVLWTVGWLCQDRYRWV